MQEISEPMLVKLILILSLFLLVLVMAIAYSSGRRLLRNYSKIVIITLATLGTLIVSLLVLQI